jgi:hypothetical protein
VAQAFGPAIKRCPDRLEPLPQPFGLRASKTVEDANRFLRQGDVAECDCRLQFAPGQRSPPPPLASLAEGSLKALPAGKARE